MSRSCSTPTIDHGPFREDDSVVKLAITLEHHDHGYVERRGGFEMLTYLLGGADRAQHRSTSIDRAMALFEQAESKERSEPAIGGLGLLVLQRALLAAEDLGLLLHAFGGPDPWDRLRAAKIPEIDTAYRRVLSEVEGLVAESFRLVTDAHIQEMQASSEQRDAARELRARVIDRWRKMLERAAGLWLNHRDVAKATMHGFPIVAGAHVMGPPRAGQIAEEIRDQQFRFAVAVGSRAKGSEVTTNRVLVRLDSAQVGSYARYGRTAARLAAELCESHAYTINTGYAATIPLRSARFLPRGHRDAIDALNAHFQEEL